MSGSLITSSSGCITETLKDLEKFLVGSSAVIVAVPTLFPFNTP